MLRLGLFRKYEVDFLMSNGSRDMTGFVWKSCISWSRATVKRSALYTEEKLS